MTLRLVPGGPGSPVRGTLEAVQAAAPGDVLVIDHGGRADANSFGGIAAFTAVRRGIAGVVIDGVSRDVDEMKGMGFPAYGRGIIQQSVRGRCAYDGHAIEVAIAGVPVRPGDLVMADENGVVVVPRGRADEASLIAEEVAASEERVKAWIAAGVDPVEAHERVRYEGGSPGRKA
jgi:regulator of RNase E activity RraA